MGICLCPPELVQVAHFFQFVEVLDSLSEIIKSPISKREMFMVKVKGTTLVLVLKRMIIGTFSEKVHILALRNSLKKYNFDKSYFILIKVILHI